MRTRRRVDGVDLAAFAIGCGAVAVAAGWSLSALRLLGQPAYAIIVGVIAVGLLAIAVRMRQGRIPWRPRRFRQLWPALFFVCWAVATLGGAIHPPSNIDALTYRLPRVMHWLSAGHWHWIVSDHPRMNYSATGMEWLSAPVLALGHSARLLFVFNAMAYLLLPSLIFVALKWFGAADKAAWRWMWLTPLALCFVLQAGSVANDLPGVFCFAATFAFISRAFSSQQSRWIGFALVSLGLATAVKSSNVALVPMALMAIVVAWRRLRPTRRGSLSATFAVLVALVVSAAPTLILNWRHDGHWSGDRANATGLQPGSIPVAAMANVAVVVLQNTAPPIFPWAGAWNAWGDQSVIPWWRAQFGAAAFPRLSLHISEFPQEEWAGLGLPFVVLLAVEWFVFRGSRRRVAPRTRAMLWLGVGGAALYCCTMGSEMPARLLSPFYLVAIVAVAVKAPDVDIRTNRCWRFAAGVTFATALGSVIFTPARPLFPAQSLWAWAAQHWPENGIVRRAKTAYEVYANRADMLGAVRGDLNRADARVGFFATDDDSEWSLWQPLGARCVIHVSSLVELQGSPVDVVVVRSDRTWADLPIARTELERAGFAVVSSHALTIKASRGLELWLVARRIKPGHAELERNLPAARQLVVDPAI